LKHQSTSFEGFGNVLMGDLPLPIPLEETECDAHRIAERLSIGKCPPALKQAKDITHVNSCLDRDTLQGEWQAAFGVRLPGVPAGAILPR
jgi:hypothetical protein